jgi:hypothetical protein
MKLAVTCGFTGYITYQHIMHITQACNLAHEFSKQIYLGEQLFCMIVCRSRATRQTHTDSQMRCLGMVGVRSAA